MHIHRVFSTTIVALGLLLSGLPGAAAFDFQAQVEAVFKSLANYDLGANDGTPQALEDLVKSTLANPQQQKQLAGRLAAVLSSKAPRGAKELACRHLAMIGTAEEVPALARLLADEQLSYLARLAIERIPGPAADEALRQAAKRLKGKLLIGVIHSLGERRDEKAVELLWPLLSDVDPALAEAAIRALARLDGLSARTALLQAFNNPPPGRLPLLAEALLDAAEGDTQLTFTLSFIVSQASVPQALRRRALSTAIQSGKPEALALLDIVCGSDDRRSLDIGLWLVRKGSSPKINAKIVQSALKAVQNPRTPPERAALLLAALADRGDRAALAAVRELAEQGPAPVRAAAVEALAKLGDASTVPMLSKLASAGTDELSQAAAASLANMPGKEIDKALLDTPAKTDAKVRVTVIGLLGQRRTAGATPLLLQSAQDQDPAVRAAAIKALAGTARAADLDALAGLLLASADPKAMEEVGQTIAAVSLAVSDKDACTAKLAARFPQARPAAKAALLGAMSQIGGRKALESVRAAMSDANAETRDVAIRALCDWPSGEAASDLRQVAESTSDRKLKILALRGFIRLIGQSDLGVNEKLSMAADAMRLADRIDEKRLVLGALGSLREPKAIGAALRYLDDPQLQNEAASAVLSSGDRLVRTHPGEVEKAVAKVLAAVDNPAIKKRAEQLLKRIKK